MTPASPRRPAKSILDPSFRYRPSHSTDLRETFARARRDLALSQEGCAATAKVLPITRKEQQ